MDPSLAKKLWHMIRAAYYMLRKGFCKHKLIMDLHLLLKRSKLAGKAIGNFLTFHHKIHNQHHPDIAAGGSNSGAFSCLSIDPNLAFYNPREVEFSCSNTPSYPSFFLAAAGKRKNRRRGGGDGFDQFDVAALVRELETLSGETSDAESAVASPSPALTWGFGRSPAVVRQLRITDSPFPVRDDEADGGRVDRQAEDFIRRFHEQLRLQRSVPATPENGQFRRCKPA